MWKIYPWQYLIVIWEKTKRRFTVYEIWMIYPTPMLSDSPSSNKHRNVNTFWCSKVKCSFLELQRKKLFWFHLILFIFLDLYGPPVLLRYYPRIKVVCSKLLDFLPHNKWNRTISDERNKNNKGRIIYFTWNLSKAREGFFLVGEDRRKNMATFLEDRKIDNLPLNNNSLSLLLTHFRSMFSFYRKETLAWNWLRPVANSNYVTQLILCHPWITARWGVSMHLALWMIVHVSLVFQWLTFWLLLVWNQLLCVLALNKE